MISMSPSLSISHGRTKFHQPLLLDNSVLAKFPLLLINAVMLPHSRERSRSLSPSLSMSFHCAEVTKPTSASCLAYCPVPSLNLPVLSFTRRNERGICP